MDIRTAASTIATIINGLRLDGHIEHDYAHGGDKRTVSCASCQDASRRIDEVVRASAPYESCDVLAIEIRKLLRSQECYNLGLGLVGERDLARLQVRAAALI